MSFQPPYFDYTPYLPPQQYSLLPRRGNRPLPAICCPKCLHQGRTVPLLPTLCHGVSTPNNNGKYYWSCVEPCGFFRFIPGSNNDLGRYTVPFVDPTLPPPGPPPSYPEHPNDAVIVPMFPSSSPAASPSPTRRPSVQPNTFASTPAPAIASTATSTLASVSGKITCPGCGKTANKLCQRHSCKTCCEKLGGCEHAAHRRGRLLGLVPVPQPIASATPGGVLGALILGGPALAAAIDDYNDEIHFPDDLPLSPTSLTPTTAQAPPSAPPSLTAATTMAPLASASRPASYARSLNPTWTQYLDNGKDTREKLRWMEDARQKHMIVDQITVTLVVWFEPGVEPIQAERSIPRRLSKEWRFGEDAFLCEAVGIKMDTKTIQKYCQNPDGRWWWHTFELNHPHTLLPGGFCFFAISGLQSSAMPSFSQLVGLAEVPNRNILGRNRNSAARAIPSSFGGLFPGQGRTLSASTSTRSLTASADTPPSTATPIRLDPKVLQERARSRPLPRHQVEVVIPIRQKRAPSSPGQSNHSAKRHQATASAVEGPALKDPATDQDSGDEETRETELEMTGEMELETELEMARRWPQDFSVHEIDDGLSAMQSLPGTNAHRFVRAFGVPFVKTTFTKYRNIWNAMDPGEKSRCLELPEGSEEALFSSIFRR